MKIFNKAMFDKVKKYTAAALAAGIIAAAAGCSSGGDIDAAALVNDLTTGVVFDEALTELSPSIAQKRLSLDEGEAEEITAYAGTRAIVDEIAVIKAADVDAVKAKIDAHIAEQTESYQSYRPEEVPKLNDAVVETYGDYVIMCITSDSDAAKAIIDKYIK